MSTDTGRRSPVEPCSPPRSKNGPDVVAEGGAAPLGGSRPLPAPPMSGDSPTEGTHTCHPWPQCCAGSAGARPEGPACAFAGASNRAHASTVDRNGPPLGVGRAPTLLRADGWSAAVGCSAARAGRPGAKGWTAHPEAPRTTPHNAAPFSGCRVCGGAPMRVAGSPGRATLDAPTNTTHLPPVQQVCTHLPPVHERLGPPGRLWIRNTAGETPGAPRRRDERDRIVTLSNVMRTSCMGET